jgi:hypothetical protein
MHDLEVAIVRLHELKRLGVGLAIDDFGTGYSSLAYLRQMPIDAVKIDKSFVDGVAGAAEESAVARAIIALATTLHLDTVAEGVERPEQAGHRPGRARLPPRPGLPLLPPRPRRRHGPPHRPAPGRHHPEPPRLMAPAWARRGNPGLGTPRKPRL